MLLAARRVLNQVPPFCTEATFMPPGNPAKRLRFTHKRSSIAFLILRERAHM